MLGILRLIKTNFIPVVSPFFLKHCLNRVGYIHTTLIIYQIKLNNIPIGTNLFRPNYMDLKDRF